MAPFTADAARPAVIVTVQATAIGDSYCAVAWAKRLFDWADPQTAVAALAADDEPLSAREQPMPAWARTIGRSPGDSTTKDVQRLRDAGSKRHRALS